MAGTDTLIAGRYRLLEQIAAGGMGSVWLGHDDLLDRPVAIKQLHPQPGLPPRDADIASQRAVREARLTARLHHPHAVAVYDVVEHAGRPCLIMQYLPSTSLQERLLEKGALAPATVARWGAEVAAALSAAHEVGIVHRDVKPGNILIGEDGSARITDFGIAHALGDPTLTSTGFVTGTPAFLSPEAARGVESGFAGDVFSLGASLYAAVEGRSPFGTDGNPMAVLHRAASGLLDAPRNTGALTPILRDMLAVEPAQRPPMRDAAARLRTVADAAQSGVADLATRQLTARQRVLSAPPVPAAAFETIRAEPVPVAPVNPAAPQGRPVTDAREPRRRGMALALVAVLAVAIIAAVAVLLSSRSSHGGGTGGTASTARRTTSAPAPSGTAPQKQITSPPSAAQRTQQSGASPGRASEPAAAVTNYYALLPGNTDAAWTQLTSSYQNGTAGGRDSYDAFWQQMRSVVATNAQSTGSLTAEATITYVYRSGRTVDERTAFTFVREQGRLKIDSTSVLSSHTR